MQALHFVTAWKAVSVLPGIPLFADRQVAVAKLIARESLQLYSAGARTLASNAQVTG